MACNDIDFIYPLYADVYYPVVTQQALGSIKKAWMIDRTFVCNATPVGGASKEDIAPETFIQYEGKLISRAKTDLRIATNGASYAVPNILITNIQTCAGEVLYKETAGPRNNQPTIYELETIEPFLNPFGKIEYYKMLWRKIENQVME
jgi:hypothetical protein